MRRDFAEMIARNNPAQSHWELDQLLALLFEMPGTTCRPVLEVGVHRGGSARCWRDGLLANRVVGVNLQDEWEGDLADDPWFDPVFGLPSQDGRTVTDVYRRLKGEDVGFVFVDGGHTYGEVWADFRNYAGLSGSGVVAFHDVRIVPDVRRFWEEVRVGRRSLEIWGGGPGDSGIGVLFL